MQSLMCELLWHVVSHISTHTIYKPQVQAFINELDCPLGI